LSAAIVTPSTGEPGRIVTITVVIDTSGEIRDLHDGSTSGSRRPAR
jgi:hypothetical protein